MLPFSFSLNLAHKQFLGHPGHRSSRPGTRSLPAGYPDENVYVPWVPRTAHKLLTPGHRSGDPWPPGRETPPPPGQSPEKFVYVYVPFPFLNHSKSFNAYVSGGRIFYLNSCQSRFSGVHLVLEVFQDTWRSNKESPSAYWGENLSCPIMTSNYANLHLVPISF